MLSVGKPHLYYYTPNKLTERRAFSPLSKFSGKFYGGFSGCCSGVGIVAASYSKTACTQQKHSFEKYKTKTITFILS